MHFIEGNSNFISRCRFRRVAVHHVESIVFSSFGALYLSHGTCPWPYLIYTVSRNHHSIVFVLSERKTQQAVDTAVHLEITVEEGNVALRVVNSKQ